MYASSFAKICRYQDEMFPRCQNRIDKACALVASTLILPILAHAQNPTNPNKRIESKPQPTEPEVNTTLGSCPRLARIAMKSIIIGKLVRQNRVGKACALVAAALVLPLLASAQPGQNPDQGPGQNPNQGPGQNAPSVPDEVNTVWLLVPVLGGLLLYSWRRLSKAKA